MDPRAMIEEMKAFKKFFDASTACLTEEDASYAPAEGLRTAAQMVAHVAQTVDWFIEGAFRPEGFSMDFEKYEKELASVDSLAAARSWLDRSFAAAGKTVEEHSAEEWAHPLPAGPVMGGLPRFAIFSGLNDHTAHHRGALTVYARLRGRQPAMPYM